MPFILGGGPSLGSGGGTTGTTSSKITYSQITDANGYVWKVGKNAKGVEVSREMVGSATPTASTGTGGSGKSYSSSSSSSSSSVPMSYVEAFLEWMGRQPNSSEKAKMANEGWTEDTIRRYAVTNGGNGTLMQKAKNELRQIAAPFYGGDPSLIPDSLLKTLITSGDYADASYLTNTYFPLLKGASATNPNSTPFVEAWTEMTGRSLTYTATQKLSEIIKTYGYTDVAQAAWESWVKTTQSAATGNWGAEHRAAIGTTIASVLGRTATEAELATNSNLWNLNDDAMLEYVRATPEYQSIYSSKPAWMSETDYISTAKSYDAVMRWYYGGNVTVNPDGSLSIPTGSYYQEPTPVTTTTTVTPTGAPIWKSLTNAQFASDLGLVGITVVDGKYMKDGQEVSYDSLLTYLPANTYYKDAQGYHYVQEEGAVNPKTGAAATTTKPRATTQTTTTTTSGLGNWGISYVNPNMVTQLLNNNISPETLQQQFAWTEEADYYKGIYSDILAETGVGGGIDFYKLASGAKGSGAMRAQLQQAQNMYAFKEVWRDYNGTDPSASDYQYVSSNFVSPTEYAHRMAAKESAKAKIDTINELLGRTLDHQVTLSDLEGLAMGGKGSGEIQAMIDQATRLDAFTDTLYQYKGHEPTADDYAEIAGYPSAAAFKWEITVNEEMAEMGDDIKATWLKTNPTAPLSDEQLRIMIGKSEGWGELQKQYNKAQEEETEGETARKTAMNAEKIAPIYQATGRGDFAQSLAGLPDIGSV